jgi:uncharacterized membrane protein YdjX (TVP38/TMEM64 family)
MRAMPDRRDPGSGASPRARWCRRLPLAVILLGLALFFAFGGHRYVNFETLRQHRETLQDWVAAHTALAMLVFFLAYVVVVAFSLPGAALMTMLGGFLFGTWLAGGLVVIAATLGATLVFLAARTAVGDLLRARAGPGLARLEAGFRENAMSYLLVLRLVPLFPFFLVNLAPAFFGVPLPTYVIATLLGIVPGTFVYASVGNGLGTVFAAGGEPNFAIIYEPAVLLPLLALAAFACIPVVYKRIAARRRAPKEE